MTFGCHRPLEPAYPVHHLDVLDDHCIHELITRLRPDAIINLAAINPGGPEDRMKAVNAYAARTVADRAASLGIRLIHLSTDSVLSGREAPYEDSALPEPLSEYGISKALGEEYIQAALPTATLVRTSLIYGLSVMDRGTEGFAEQLKTGSLALYSDVIRQPIYLETLSDALFRLIDIPWSGTLNIAGKQALSREAFGRRMLAYWNIPNCDAVTSMRAAMIPDCKTPLDLRLKTDRAEALLKMTFPGVDQIMKKRREIISQD